MKFIDFCAGIGGGRLGLEKLGMECIGFSEIDKNAESTYRLFFGNNETNYGDLMKINSSNLPNFDLLVAGFPCQSFSIVGQRKGLIDKRGQIIYGLLKIMKVKEVKYFILENVKGLLNHEKGQIFKTILNLLDHAGYHVVSKLLESSHYSLPHKRERVYFIGVRKNLIKNGSDFYSYFSQQPTRSRVESIKQYLIDDDNIAFTGNQRKPYQTFLKYLKNKYNKGKISVHELLKEEFLIIDTRQSDLRLYREKIPTLRTGRHGLLYVKGVKFRRVSGYESLLLQGFPKELAIKVKKNIPENRILSQAGNAMSVHVVEACGKSLIDFTRKYVKHSILLPVEIDLNKTHKLLGESVREADITYANH